MTSKFDKLTLWLSVTGFAGAMLVFFPELDNFVLHPLLVWTGLLAALLSTFVLVPGLLVKKLRGSEPMTWSVYLAVAAACSADLIFLYSIAYHPI